MMLRFIVLFPIMPFWFLMIIAVIPQYFIGVSQAALRTSNTPPYPDFDTWEPVQQLRRTLNKVNNDNNYTEGIDSNKRRRLLFQSNSTIRQQYRQLAATPIVSGLRILVLLIKFSDHADLEVPTREYFDELFNGASGDTTTNPIGSIKKYLFINSLGKYDVTFDVQDWFVTDNTEAYFAAGVSGFRTGAEMQYVFTPKLQAMDNEGFDFNPYDSTGWGTLDHMVVLTTSENSEQGAAPADCNINPPENRIHSQGFWDVGDQGWLSLDAFQVSTFALTSAFDEGMCQGKPAKMCLIVHEYMHGFGVVPDLYDADADEDPIPLGGTGKFCPMSSPFGWLRNAAKCGHLSAYTRMKVGWITPIEITKNGYYPLQPAAGSSQIYKLKLNSDGTEYLLIENRQPILWDSDVEGGGVVIYRVDENKKDQTTRGYPGHPNYPAEHYMVSVLQADGLFQIEKGESPGDAGDFWTMGMKLSPGGDGLSTDAISSGSKVSNGLTIETVSVSQLIMMVQVSGFPDSRDNNVAPRDQQLFGTNRDEPKTTNDTTAWVLSMLGGSVALVGFLAIML